MKNYCVLIVSTILFCFTAQILMAQGDPCDGALDNLWLFEMNPDCDDLETMPDGTDDEFSPNIFIYFDGNVGTWSSSDGAYTNEPYVSSGQIYSFPSTSIAAGGYTITIIDDATGCSKDVDVVPPLPCSQGCIDFDLCYDLLASDNCQATYGIRFSGDFSNVTDINNLDFSFSSNNGNIESLDFTQQLSNLENKGVTINGNSILGGSGITTADMESALYHFTITISVDNPYECVKLNDMFGGMYFGSTLCAKTNECEPPMWCSESGNDIGGNVSVPSFYNCENTSNHAVHGASVSITSSNGQSCQSTTSMDGKYECALCEDGPYEVCVDTECPEPCGLSTLDVVLMQRAILYDIGKTIDSWLFGDLNGDGNVSASDVVALRKAVLGYSNGGINWCRFVPVSEYINLPDPLNTSNPELSDAFSQIDNCITVDNPSQGVDFLQFRLGDFNASCTDCSHASPKTKMPVKLSYDRNQIRVVMEKDVKSVDAVAFEIPLPTGVIVERLQSSVGSIDYSVRDQKLVAIWVSDTEVKESVSISKTESLLEISGTNIHSLSMDNVEAYILTDQDLFNLSLTREVKTRDNQFERAFRINNQEIMLNKASDNIVIRLIDFMGRNLQSYQISEYQNSISTSTEFSTGIYLVEIVEDGISRTEKIFIP